MLRKAAGLACLELALHTLAEASASLLTPASNLSTIDVTHKKLPDPADLVKALPLLADVTRQARQLRADKADELRDKTRRNDAAGSKALAAIRKADRDARFRPGGGPGDRPAAEVDQPAADLDAVGRRNALILHARRLSLDYAVDDEVRALLASALEAYAGEIPTVEPLNGAIVVRAGEVRIDQKRRAGDLRVTLQAGDEKAKVPPGKAFVGVLASEPPPPADGAKGPPTGLLVEHDGARSKVPGFAGGLVEVKPGEAPSGLDFLIRQPDSATGGPTRTLQVTAFYRGRIDESARTKVAVHTLDYGAPLEIVVSHDIDVLREKYGKEIADSIEDQFVGRQNEGYFHERGELAYTLTFRNTTPQPLTVAIEMTMKSVSGSLPPIPLRAPETKEIKPEEPYIVRDRLNASRVQIGEPRVLEVKVTSGGKELIPTRRITFTQLRLDDYIGKLSLDRRPFPHNRGPVVPCYVIEITRLEKDPVTEPIRYADINCTFDGKAPDRPNLPAKGYLGRGQSLFLSSPVPTPETAQKDIQWNLEIERTSVSNKTSEKK